VIREGKAATGLTTSVQQNHQHRIWKGVFCR